ncbi:MAG: hypothetical protein HC838_09815 [Spirulinaceae cyanobacterium RM2_2_10]|nr:hypothetical protein [Spirulinaceae cyanobacterium SM2_1_0]NJO20269.1 hypothetical protein [Spirulinaceae cyanobacterium RM2_2_10]
MSADNTGILRILNGDLIAAALYWPQAVAAAPPIPKHSPYPSQSAFSPTAAYNEAVDLPSVLAAYRDLRGFERRG